MYKSPATRETCTFKKTQTQYIYDKKVTILSTLLFLVLLVSSVSYFNRAPERLIPDNVDVLSPVNGTVIHIEDTEQSEIDFYKKDVLQSLAIAGMTPPFQFVVVEMDPSNIHVQRAPITGVIT
ncbi:MAG: phosphatidylserine decarboxylase, partial [Planctomycetota bacterium]